MAQMFEKEKSLWNPGKMGGIEFISSIKRLEKELPELYKVIELREGFETDYEGYHYKVGNNKYGLWLSRRKLGNESEQQHQQSVNKITEDKPPARPSMAMTEQQADPTMVQVRAQLTVAVKLLTLSHLASSDDERNDVRRKVLAQ